MEYLCEVIAAMKLRTTNLQRRHLSTGGAIDLLIDTGIETPDGLLRVEPNVLTRSMVNCYFQTIKEVIEFRDQYARAWARYWCETSPGARPT